MMIRILIIVLIVLAGAAALTELNPSVEKTTNPIIKGLNTVRGWFSNSTTLPLPGADKNKTTVYKWQDASGEWHFSNQPPPAGTSSSVKTYRSDVNITQAPPPPVAAKPEPTENAATIPTGPAPLLPITDPGRVKQLIEDAQNVQKLVGERQQKLDEQLPQ
jgi:Domain of unknown function (DUF4124)